MSIPKTIWQTYKDPYEKLQPYMIDVINTWKKINPEYEYNYMDDKQASDFVLKEYGQEWYDIFINLPVGVMRGDIWRYLVIYKYGGIYTDLDTRCLKPIDTWLKDEYEMIICPENDIHFCQWTFAAVAGHPALEAVINKVKSRLLNQGEFSPDFVHIHTGPGVWTEGIQEFFEFKSSKILNDFDNFNLSEKVKKYKTYCYGGAEWRIFHFQASEHIYGSQKWSDGQYVQWIKDPLLN